MASCFSAMRFTLFGSRDDKAFKEKKSLLENFIAMCSISCFLSDTPETTELLEVIKTNDFNNQDVINQYTNNLQYYSDDTEAIMVINTSILDRSLKINLINEAIEKWIKVRKKDSSRVNQIENFQRSILDLKNKKINREIDSSSLSSSSEEQEYTSLMERFNSMCGLAWYQIDSGATDKLTEIIKKYDQIANNTKINSLDKKIQMDEKLADLDKAIDKWKEVRKGGLSSRYEQVKAFQRSINNLVDENKKTAYNPSSDFQIEMDDVISGHSISNSL